MQTVSAAKRGGLEWLLTYGKPKFRLFLLCEGNGDGTGVHFLDYSRHKGYILETPLAAAFNKDCVELLRSTFQVLSVAYFRIPHNTLCLPPPLLYIPYIALRLQGSLGNKIDPKWIVRYFAFEHVFCSTLRYIIIDQALGEDGWILAKVVLRFSFYGSRRSRKSIITKHKRIRPALVVC